MITYNFYKKFYGLRIFSLFALIIIFVSCEEPRPELGLKSGIWRGEITAQGNRIPFNFEVNKADGAYEILLVNGKEKLKIDRIDIFGDSLFFDMHIFDISIKAKIDQEELTGLYSKNYAEGYILPFKAKYGKEGRFDEKGVSDEFDGTWETTFTDVKGKKTTAIGIFESDSTGLNGTFLSKTGDYRFLDGYVGT